MKFCLANTVKLTLLYLILGLLVILAENGGSSVDAQDDSVARFHQKLDAWRSKIVDLTVLRQEFFFAESRVKGQEFREKYDETKAEGDRIVRELKIAAADAYRKQPDEQSEYYNFLLKSLSYDLEESEDQTVAIEIARALNSHPIRNAEIASQVGKCLFMNNDFEEAEKLLKYASTSDTTLEDLLQLISKLKPRWKEEQQKRAQDKAAKLPRAIIETTKGSFVVELFEDDAPNTVKNFVNLAQKGFYDKQTFFRVTPYSFAATGSPNSEFTGTPGYLIKNEGMEPTKRRGNFRGTLCVPAVGEDKSRAAGSIFMITFGPYQTANTSAYCNFGRVIEGMQVVDSLERSQSKEGEKKEEFQPDRIIRVTIENLRDTPYEPEVIPH